VETVLPYLTGPAGALAVLIWVVWMQRKDIADLRRAAEAERSRADSAEEAARTSSELLRAILDQAKR
jgi:hypothetical protein